MTYPLPLCFFIFIWLFTYLFFFRSGLLFFSVKKEKERKYIRKSWQLVLSLSWLLLQNMFYKATTTGCYHSSSHFYMVSIFFFDLRERKKKKTGIKSELLDKYISLRNKKNSTFKCLSTLPPAFFYYFYFYNIGYRIIVEEFLINQRINLCVFKIGHFFLPLSIFKRHFDLLRKKMMD